MKNSIKDLLNLKPEELKSRLVENKKNIMGFRFGQKAGMETKSHMVSQWKKDIARIKTLESQKRNQKTK